VARDHERITVTVQGHPSAVLLAVDDLEALEEPSPSCLTATRSGSSLPPTPNWHAERVNPSRTWPPRRAAAGTRYRVVYSIDDDRHQVTVVAVVRRADAYRT